jgi:excisionase family DNA binding protein
MTTNTNSPLLTVSEAATYLNVSRSSIYRLIEEFKLPTVKLFKRKQYISQNTLDELIEQSALNIGERNNNVN